MPARPVRQAAEPHTHAIVDTFLYLYFFVAVRHFFLLPTNYFPLVIINLIKSRLSSLRNLKNGSLSGEALIIPGDLGDFITAR